MTHTNTPADTSVHAVLFDYGMVLSGPPNTAAWGRMQAVSTLSEDVLHREYWKHRHPYDRGTYTAEAYWRLIAEGAETTFTEAQIADLIDADTDLWTDLNLPMVDWARRLPLLGVKTGILSNIGDAMEAGVRRKLLWIEEFDHCVWSHALKLAKPEAAIYGHAAEGLEVAPENILFIDDRADNIEAALAFGMQGIQYLNHAAFLKEIEFRGLQTLLRPHQPSI